MKDSLSISKGIRNEHLMKLFYYFLYHLIFIYTWLQLSCIMRILSKQKLKPRVSKILIFWITIGIQRLIIAFWLDFRKSKAELIKKRRQKWVNIFLLHKLFGKKSYFLMKMKILFKIWRMENQQSNCLKRRGFDSEEELWIKYEFMI